MIDFDYPKTVDDAVERLLSRLSLREKVHLAGMDKEAVGLIHSAFGPVIREDFGLAAGNRDLIRSCREVSGREDLTAGDAYWVLVDAIRKELQTSYSIRIVSSKSD
jgi:hypothetical protein